MIYLLCIVGAILAVGLSGFYSGSETGLYCLNRLRLKLRADQGDRHARRLAHIVADEHNALTTLLIGTNVSNYLATVAVAYLLTRAAGTGPGRSEIYTTLIVTPAIFVFGELVPKNLFQRHADQLMYLGSAMFRVSVVLCALPAAILGWISKPITALVDPAGLSTSADPRSNIATLLQEAMAGDDAPGRQSELIDRVLSLPRVALHQVMVPRNRVVSIQAGADLKQFLSLVRKHECSRLPVYEDNPRRIVGYVHVHALLADQEWEQVGDHLRKIVSLDAHESVASAIVKLQTSRETLGAVTDRNGYLLGVVTRKDLLEELTGELHEW